jgi:hypothetical protein
LQCNYAANLDECIEQKIFHADIVVDNARVVAETKAYRPIPVIQICYTLGVYYPEDFAHAFIGIDNSDDHDDDDDL